MTKKFWKYIRYCISWRCFRQ